MSKLWKIRTKRKDKEGDGGIKIVGAILVIALTGADTGAGANTRFAPTPQSPELFS